MILQEHHLHLLYVCDQVDWYQEPNWTFADFARTSSACLGAPPTKSGRHASVFPPEWRRGLARYDESMWRKVSDASARKMASDISEPIRDVLDGRESSLAKVYEANWENRLDCLLNGRGLWEEGFPLDCRERLSLEMPLRKAAARRLGSNAISQVALRLAPPRLYQFRTGVRVLDLPVTIGRHVEPVSSLLAQEVTHALLHAAELVWVDTARNPSTGFSLEDLANCLIAGPNKRAVLSRRPFTASFVAVQGSDGAEPTPDNGKLAAFLAKHFTSDYHLSSEETSAVVQRPFDNLWRAVAPEGATLLTQLSENSPDFMRRFYRGPFLQAYLPLAILATHEKSAWIALSRRSNRWVTADSSQEAELAELQEIRSLANAIRLAFSFPWVSKVAAHGQWTEALELTSGLPRLRKALADELAAAESLIRDDTERALKRAAEQGLRRFNWASVVAAAAATCVTIFSLGKDLFAPSFTNVTWVIKGPIAMSPPAALATAGGLLGGLLAGFIVHRRLRAGLGTS